VVLTGATPPERSRELAAALALIIDQHEPRPRPEQARTTKPQPTRARRPRGWIGVGPRIGLGPPAAIDPDVGASLTGGCWLVGEHIQPVVRGGWSASTDGDLRLDGIRIGAGLLAGSALVRGHAWLGAGAVGHAFWAQAEDQRADRRWVSSTELAAAFQVRGRRGLLVGLRTGVDLTLPPLRARGESTAIRWGVVRFFAELWVGLHF
jgi:hypothetical protein